MKVMEDTESETLMYGCINKRTSSEECSWCGAKHTGKPSITRLWAVALQGKERKSRGEERTSMWKGKEEDSKGTKADVQVANLQIQFCSFSSPLSLCLAFFFPP